MAFSSNSYFCRGFISHLHNILPHSSCLFLFFSIVTQVFQVQREALFHKSERQVAEAQLQTVQQQLADLQAQSSHIQQLHQDIQHSKGLIKEKDHKVCVHLSQFSNPHTLLWSITKGQYLVGVDCYDLGKSPLRQRKTKICITVICYGVQR